MLLCLAVGSMSAAAAQAVDSTRAADMRVLDARVLDAVERSGSLSIDGRIDEAAWETAPMVSGFTQQEPDAGQPSTERTEVLLLYDDNALYVAFRCYVEDPATLVARITRRDGFPESDRVSVDIDSRDDDRTAYFFAVTAGGTQEDGLLFNDTDGDTNWDAVYVTGTARTSYGWSAEFRIPLSQLRFDEGAETWGIQFQRDIAHRDEITFWAPILPDVLGYVSRFGTLRGVQDLRPRQRAEIVPYAATRLARLPGDTADPFFEANDVGLNAGADFELGIGSGLTLTGTINPDFGQVEVDPAVLNLTIFEDFFEERRPFFVEGAEVFDFGRTRTRNSDFAPRDFFYSRRIGAAPRIGVGGDFDAIPTETTIAGAAKFTGRIGNWDLGVLEAVTTDEMGRFATFGDDGEIVEGEETVQPWANYAVVRARRGFRAGQSVVGGLVTATNRALGDNPVLRQNLAASAYTVGLDFEHAFGDRQWIVSGVGAVSHVRGSTDIITDLQRRSIRYYQRPDADYLEVDSAATSLSGLYSQLSIAKLGGAWRGSLTATTATPGFELNDLGFQTRADGLSLAGNLAYQQPRPRVPWLRYWELSSNQGLTWSYGGDLVTAYLRTFADIVFENRWGVFASAVVRPEVFDIRLTRGGPLMREPAEFGGRLTGYTDPGRTVYAEVQLDGEITGLDGASAAAEVEVGWRPTPSVRFELVPVIQWARTPLQFYRSAADPNATATFGRRYVFSETRTTEFVLGTRLDWTFTPTLSLELFLRPSIFAVDYGRLYALARPRTFDLLEFEDDAIERGGFDEAGGFVPDPAGSQLRIDADGDPATADTFTLRRRSDFNDRFLQGAAVLRWEYRPGSTVFLVWQHQRFGFDTVGDFDAGRDLQAVFDAPAENIFLVKATYWLGR
ncbi:MAG: DUF5916 domain-containing protein [Bacteroidota bacterium]